MVGLGEMQFNSMYVHACVCAHAHTHVCLYVYAYVCEDVCVHVYACIGTCDAPVCLCITYGVIDFVKSSVCLRMTTQSYGRFMEPNYI